VTTSTSTSQHAHLYVGDPDLGPPPVFRDLSPEPLQDRDGGVVPWPKDARFAVFFPSTPESGWVPDDLDRWAFFDDAGWPVGFPAEARASSSLKKELQSFPYAWWRWSRSELCSAVRDEVRSPGIHERLRAQAGLIRRRAVPSA
jgi:hypothetical protein